MSKEELWNLFLLSDIADGRACSAGRTRVLASNLQPPNVSHATMQSDLSHSFKVLSQLCVPAIRHQLIFIYTPSHTI